MAVEKEQEEVVRNLLAAGADHRIPVADTQWTGRCSPPLFWLEQ
jgi:hypothetical protein